ncbi:MAG TPA: DUF1028 domain-containing protein [Humisphaera sp.]|jgi:uncharacterized Ntn-hydrolase superfamily protein|nr:DUF1028 domain-containing protein [Humisphaera sp.]
MLRFNLRIAAILAVPVLLAGILAIHSAASPREGQMAQTRQTPQIRIAAQDAPGPPVATFSILGFDPATGEVGGAVQSRVFSVGNGVLWADADAGAAATQAIVDVSYGPRALALLKQGLAPTDIIKQIWEKDPDPRPRDWSKDGRQFAVINLRGQTATFTGTKATAWAGGKQGKFCTAQGNILAGEAVVNEMVEAFEKAPATGAAGHLSFRLMAALEAGQKAGGDKRGMQSAAMIIVKKDGGVWLHNDTVLRLQVDDNPEPLKELRRLVEKAATQRPRGRG